MTILAIVLALLLGFACGMLFQMTRVRPITDEPSIPYKRVRVTMPRMNFGDQLDPVLPEGTKRKLFKGQEVMDDE
jgi:uncharacterized protein YneF (UPF0154 family)